MSPVEENIEILSRAVFDEAHDEAEKVLSEARAKAKDVLSRAKEQADAERREILEHASQEVERLRRQADATAQLGARTLQMQRREKLLENAFDTARRQLPTVQQWNNYRDITRTLLQEALTHLDVKAAKVQADETTLKLLTSGIIAETMKEQGVELHIGEPLKNGTGLILETMDGRRRYDSTLETRLSLMKNALRTPVYHILSGEAI